MKRLLLTAATLTPIGRRSLADAVSFGVSFGVGRWRSLKRRRFDAESPGGSPARKQVAGGDRAAVGISPAVPQRRRFHPWPPAATLMVTAPMSSLAEKNGKEWKSGKINAFPKSTQVKPEGGTFRFSDFFFSSRARATEEEEGDVYI